MSLDLSPGARIGRFVVTRQLGEGGMGTVVEARDPELDRRVALKVMRADRSDTLRLLREAQALATLSHPNVVSVHELGTHDGDVFIAMELVDGVPLDRWLLAAPRTWREILAVWVQAGRGLAAVHAKGLVHRDVKPSNVFVDGEGRARIGDFGLARRDAGSPSTPATRDVRTPASESAESPDVTAASSDDDGDGDASEGAPTPGGRALVTPLTRTGALLGTPRYMAPEQHEGARATHRADQFAFCVGLWESLYQQHPFGAESLDALRDAVRAGRLREPPRSAVPAWLHRVIVRGLARDPETRWPSMSSLLDEVERVPRRRRTFAIAAGAAVVLVGSVSAAALLSSSGQRHVDCARAAMSADSEWSPPVRGALGDHLRSLGGAWAGDAGERLLAAVDAWDARWRGVRIDACRAAHDRGEQSTAILDQRTSCLARQRVVLGALVAGLGAADTEAAVHGFDAIAHLPSPESCTATRVAALPKGSHPEAEKLIAEASAAAELHSTGARDVAERAVAAADLTGAPGLQAESRIAHARIVADTDVARARADLESAQQLAAQSRDPILESQVAIRAVLDAADHGSVDRIDALLTAARAAVARAGQPADLARELARTEVMSNMKAARLDPMQAACASYVAVSTGDERDDAQASCDCRIALVKRDNVGAPAPCTRLVENDRRRFGENHPTTVADSHNLAIALMRAARLDDAEPLARANLERTRALYGEGSLEVVSRLQIISVIEDRLKRPADSVKTLAQAMDILDRIPGAAAPTRAGLLLELADRTRQLGDAANAINYAERGLAAAEAAYGKDHPDLMAALLVHAQCLGMDAAQRDRAIASFDRAVALVLRTDGPRTFRYGAITWNYAEWLTQHDGLAAAEPLAAKAVAAMTEGGSVAEAARTNEFHGDVLKALGRHAEARAAFERARQKYVEGGPDLAEELAALKKKL